eukprot:2944447-Pyramimonas_sp.AAC.1
MEVVWAPFHLGESLELLASAQQRLFVVGDPPADAWAGKGAELAWEFRLMAMGPDTERDCARGARGAQARARRALAPLASSETRERASRACVHKAVSAAAS